MQIHSRTDVKQTFKAALKASRCHETALHSTAQALGLPVEAVRECIEEGVTQ